MAEVYESQSRPRKRWGRRLLITFLVLLVFLAVVLVVVDRFGKSYAERMISDRVAQEVRNRDATAEQPDVTVEGVPFLTQVVDGRYQEIRIGLRNLSAAGPENEQITMPRLDVRARDVQAPLSALRGGQQSIVAGKVTGTGLLDYATLVRLINREGVQLSERGGKLAVTAPVPVDLIRQQVVLNGTANLEVVDGNVIRVSFEQVTAEDLPNVPLVQNIVNNYARQLGLNVRVPALPLDMKVEKVQPTAAGLVVTAGANDVPLNAARL